MIIREKKYIICSTHGALFKIEDGYCISGPCQSSSLEAVPVTIKNGDVLIVWCEPNWLLGLVFSSCIGKYRRNNLEYWAISHG